MSNIKAIKAIHAMTSAADLKNLPSVPAETFFGELYLDGNEIYSENHGDFTVLLYQHELPFYPHVTLKYSDLIYLDEATVAQEDTIIFDFKNFKVLHDRDLTFLASDLDDPDEDVEFYHQESFSKNFNDITGLLSFLKSFFGKQGFKKNILTPTNLKNIFRNLENNFYRTREQKAA
jgi:hypothetical protein